MFDDAKDCPEGVDEEHGCQPAIHTAWEHGDLKGQLQPNA